MTCDTSIERGFQEQFITVSVFSFNFKIEKKPSGRIIFLCC